MDCLTSRILLQKVCSYKRQFCTKASQVYMMAVQKCKKKYLMHQIPIKMLKKHGIPNSSLHNLKIYSSKGCRKTSQRWIICTYLTRTAILNIRIFSRRYHFRLWVFASTDEYFYYWHWRVLPNVSESKYDAKTFQNLRYYFYALCSQIIICIV